MAVLDDHVFAISQPEFLRSYRACLASVLLLRPHDTSIFSRDSTPAGEVHSLGIFAIAITAGIFVSVAILLFYTVLKYRRRAGDINEPPQIFGSTQIELAWTIIPILLIFVLFLGTTRVIFAVQDAPKPKNALDVTAIGHQFWWEFRYPTLGIVTANELHVPLSEANAPMPTFLKLTSADVIHSFWVPRLAGKTDLLPNRVNEMWIDPHETGLYEGQCAQFCGAQHAKMLLRIYVDSPEQFRSWVATQQETQQSHTSVEAATNALPTNATPAASAQDNTSAITPQQGRRVFEEQACMNCHTIAGTAANGRYGPDLTHLMSRDTLGSGIVPNGPQNLLAWIVDPNNMKPGTLMPAMHLTDVQNKQLVAYLTTLR